MMIRKGKLEDVAHLAKLEEESYGKDGYSADSIQKMMEEHYEYFFVLEKSDEVVGFACFHHMKDGTTSEGFHMGNIPIPTAEKSAHSLAFTTQSHYESEDDVALLDAAKDALRNDGYKVAYVFLPVKHKFPAAHEFWKSQGYEYVGKSEWKSHSGETYETRLCRKLL